MPIQEMSMKEFRQIAEREDKDWYDWEKERKKKKCKCGNLYTYGYETAYKDPGSCPECRDSLGELVR